MEVSDDAFNRDRGHPLWIRTVSGSVCVLSVLGSSLIIISYLFVKSVRSKARELLVHIATMDLLYTTANLVGLALPYQEHLVYKNNSTAPHEPSDYKTYHYVCLTQAFVAIYGTVGSILWTVGLAVYLYYRVVVLSDTTTRRVLYVMYIVCYLLPLYVSLWLLFDNGLGYSPDISSGAGWCSLNTQASGTNDSGQMLLVIMTYDVWIFVGLVLLLPLYLSIYAHVRQQERDDAYFYIRQKTEMVERKLLIVPIVFFFLRVWDLINDILFLCHGKSTHDLRHHKWLLLLTAIGDSGQGFANFIIFVLLQRRLRHIAIRCICCGYCWQRRRNQSNLNEFSSSTMDSHPRSSSQFSQYTCSVE